MLEAVDNKPSRWSMIVVLNDGETFTNAAGCVLAEVHLNGVKELNNGSVKYTDDALTKYVEIEITMQDLLDAYNKVHGTKYEL